MSLADAHSCHTLKPRRFGKRLTKIKQQKRMRGNLESCIGNLESFFKKKTAESMRGMIAFATLTFRAETNKDIHTAPNTHTHATHVSSTRFVQPSDLGYGAGEEGCRTGSVPDKKKISKVSALVYLLYYVWSHYLQKGHLRRLRAFTSWCREKGYSSMRVSADTGGSNLVPV